MPPEKLLIKDRKGYPLITYLTAFGLLILISLVVGILLIRQAPEDETSPFSAAYASDPGPEQATTTGHGDGLMPANTNAGPSMDEREYAQRFESIALSAQYLIRAIQDNGRFTYRINLNPSITHKPRYNVLRHAGTMYALGMYHDLTMNDEAKSALQSAGKFLRYHCIAPVAEENGLLAVWSRPELNGTDAAVQAKLGGSGLGLVGLLSLEKASPGTTSLDDLRGLGRFILFMQKEDGSFYSKYIPSKGGRRDNWTSLYYPGEAALGLIMLHGHDPNPHWLEGATKALIYLARTREDQDEVPADHWALLASAQLMTLYRDTLSDVEQSMLLRHTIQISERILSQQVSLTDSALLLGGFTKDSRTTPTATRLEGLLAALEVIPNRNTKIRKRITKSVQRGMVFLTNAQVLTGEHAGAMPRAIRQLPDDGTSKVKSFNRRATEVRIDYVQHALSAMIQYVDAFGPEHDRTAQVGN